MDRLKYLANLQQERADNEPVDIHKAIDQDIADWLQWVDNFLEQRKLYHKKAYVRKAILERMAKTLLSADELAAIDKQAEEQLQGASPTTISVETEHEEVE